MANKDLACVLRDLYASEINVRINWCWDGGFDVAIGNAFCCGMNEEPEAKATFEDPRDIAPWLIETACRLYPESDFAKSEAQKEVHARAAKAFFADKKYEGPPVDPTGGGRYG